MVMATQKIVPFTVWGTVGLLFFRFFIPMDWLDWIPWLAGEEGYLLLWLPYEVSAWVWTGLGGAIP